MQKVIKLECEVDMTDSINGIQGFKGNKINPLSHMDRIDSSSAAKLIFPPPQRLPSYAGHHSTQLGTAFIHRGFVPRATLGHKDAAEATRRAPVSVLQRSPGGLSNEDTT